MGINAFSPVVSPYDANCVTPLIYPTTALDFLFGIIVSCDLRFYFLFFETFTNLFVNGIIPPLLLPKKVCTVHRYMYMFAYFTSIH